jgi:hypothetical protein
VTRNYPAGIERNRVRSAYGLQGLMFGRRQANLKHFANSQHARQSARDRNKEKAPRGGAFSTTGVVLTLGLHP